jgi:hypothetical protein
VLVNESEYAQIKKFIIFYVPSKNRARQIGLPRDKNINWRTNEYTNGVGLHLRPTSIIKAGDGHVIGLILCGLMWQIFGPPMMFTACLPQHSQNPTRSNISSGWIRNSYLLNKQMIRDNSWLGLANTQDERFITFLVIKIKGNWLLTFGLGIILLQGVSSRKYLAGVNIMYTTKKPWLKFRNSLSTAILQDFPPNCCR